ncbi:Hypothetical predicted protein [Marmota monax]|uniref:Uncharacterized protein n=1 Tax=Marmota monax TaxID=9995 RepID=A0A5E4B566_MARMO|nr:Hypothetical predicted protein [Marmota monax]
MIEGCTRAFPEVPETPRKCRYCGGGESQGEIMEHPWLTSAPDAASTETGQSEQTFAL